MGFSLRRMFRHPFGKHSLFHKATQIASVLPIPGSGLIGKAFSLFNRGKNAYDDLQRRVNPVLTAAGALHLVPSQAPRGVMPGGSRVGGAARPTTRRQGTHRPRAARRSSRKRRGVRRRAR